MVDFQGTLRKRESMRRRYWWPGMRAAVRHYCRSCLVCAYRKGQSRSIKPPLQPITVGRPFSEVGADVLQLPLTLESNRSTLVFIDYLSRNYCEYVCGVCCLSAWSTTRASF